MDLPPHQLCTCTVNPVIGDIEDIGSRAVHTAVNNLAASGADPVAVLPSIMIPLDVGEQQLKADDTGYAKSLQ